MTAIVDHGRSCFASVVGVGGRDLVARADVRQRAAARDRELDRRARAGGLVGVREGDVGDAERRQRGGQLVGGGRAERGRKREVDLVDAERAQVGGEPGDGLAVGRAGGRRVDDRQRRLAAGEPARGLLGVSAAITRDAERLERARRGRQPPSVERSATTTTSASARA